MSGGKKVLPTAIADKVRQWAGPHIVLHFWEQDKTFFVIARSISLNPAHTIFLRVFPVGGEFQLSQDGLFIEGEHDESR